MSTTRREQPDRAAKQDTKEFLDKNAKDMVSDKAVTPNIKEGKNVETYKPPGN